MAKVRVGKSESGYKKEGVIPNILEAGAERNDRRPEESAG
jgi:hypothetical protein